MSNKNQSTPAPQPDNLLSHIYELEIVRCENQNEFEQLVKNHQSLYSDWSAYIRPLLTKKGLTAAAIAEGCGVSQSTASGFARKIPSKRESVIMLAAMMGLSVDETNTMLTRWAKFQRLYSKHPSDAIWVYILNRGGTQSPAADFEGYFKTYKSILKSYRADKAAAAPVLNTHEALGLMLSAQDDAAFAAHIRSLIPSFEVGYQKLIDYIDEIFERTDESINTLFEFNEACRNRYYTRMRNLRRNHEIPSREYLIAFGIHLRLSTEDINHLLELAGMGPLCPKDRLESAILFYLEELFCQFPSMFYRPDELECGDGLLDADENDSISAQIELDIFGLPKEDFSEYVRRRLEETNISLGSPDAVDRFLELL